MMTGHGEKEESRGGEKEESRRGDNDESRCGENEESRSGEKEELTWRQLVRRRRWKNEECSTKFDNMVKNKERRDKEKTVEQKKKM